MARIKTAGHVVLILLSILLGALVIPFGVLLALSPGRPRPILDENGKVLEGSISEKTLISLTLRASRWQYWPPKSIMTTPSDFSALMAPLSFECSFAFIRITHWNEH